MFQSKNNRYVTRGVDDSVPVETQFFLWLSCIDSRYLGLKKCKPFPKLVYLILLK